MGVAYHETGLRLRSALKLANGLGFGVAQSVSGAETRGLSGAEIHLPTT
jgi:hypothetical protein